MRVKHYVCIICIFVCDSVCVCTYICTTLFSSDCDKAMPPPQAPKHRAMQQTQGRKRQDEEAELLAEETGHCRARRVISDALYSQWRSGLF